MVQNESKLRFGDNSDARLMLCVHPNTKGSFWNNTNSGSFVNGSVYARRFSSEDIKSKVNWALVVNTSRKLVRGSGESLSFRHSKLALVDDDSSRLLGARVYGVAVSEMVAFPLFVLLMKISAVV